MHLPAEKSLEVADACRPRSVFPIGTKAARSRLFFFSERFERT